jgi:glutamate decarboxylase
MHPNACDENTTGVVAVLRLTFDGSDEPVAEMATGVGPAAGAHRMGHSAACGRRVREMIPPFLDPDLMWDLQQSRVASINTSGHSTV